MKLLIVPHLASYSAYGIASALTYIRLNLHSLVYRPSILANKKELTAMKRGMVLKETAVEGVDEDGS